MSSVHGYQSVRTNENSNFATTLNLGERPHLRAYTKSAENTGVKTDYEIVSNLDILTSAFDLATTAETVVIVSTTASDDTAGVGAQAVRICYLDSKWEHQEIRMELGGLVPISLPTTVLRVNTLEVVRVGTKLGSNDGIINLTGLTTGIIYAQIEVGERISKFSQISCGVDHELYIPNITLNGDSSGGKVLKFRLWCSDGNDPNLTPVLAYTITSVAEPISLEPAKWIKLRPKITLWMEVVRLTGTGESLSGVLIDVLDHCHCPGAVNVI